MSYANIVNGRKALADNRLEEAFNEFALGRTADGFEAEAACGCGVIWHHRGDLDKARQEYETAIRLRPSYSRPYFNMAALFLRAEDYRSAIPFLEKFQSLEETIDAMFWLGFSYLQISNSERAAGWLTKCIVQDQKHASARFYRGIALAMSDRFTDAIRDVEIALQLEPSLPGGREWHEYISSRLGRTGT